MCFKHLGDYFRRRTNFFLINCSHDDGCIADSVNCSHDDLQTMIAAIASLFLLTSLFSTIQNNPSCQLFETKSLLHLDHMLNLLVLFPFLKKASSLQAYMKPLITYLVKIHSNFLIIFAYIQELVSLFFVIYNIKIIQY